MDTIRNEQKSEGQRKFGFVDKVRDARLRWFGHVKEEGQLDSGWYVWIVVVR